MTIQFRTVVVCALISISTAMAAKIAPTKPVPPVECNGVRYSADGDGRDQYVVATDIATGKQLWRVKVFHTHIKPWIEEDVQWVFISDLKLLKNSLFVRGGKERCYTVDVKTHAIGKADCSGAFADRETSAH